MERQKSTLSPIATARLAGGFYLITILCALFAEIVARGSLIVDGDATETARNILASESLFRFGLAADMVAVASYAAVTFFLYELFVPVNKHLSLLAAVFSLVGIATLAVDGLTQLAADLLVQQSPYLAPIGVHQLQAMALFALTLHSQGYSISDIFFGVYCIFIGWLAARSALLPRVIGVLMAVGGAGYIVNGFANILLPSLGNPALDYLPVLGLLGEGSLTAWLLIVGVRRATVRATQEAAS